MTKHSALVLDQDTEASNEIATHLTAEGVKTRVCTSIQMLLTMLEVETYHICLIGSRLRDGDGLDLVRTLRQSRPCGLIVIGHSDDELDTVLALELGADDYVFKPLRLREIAARVRAVMRRTLKAEMAEGGGARALPDEYLTKIGNLEICGILRIVTFAGEEISLTTREFDILMVLASRPNSVLSRDEIIRLLNGKPGIYNDRLVDGVVSRLRRKLFDKTDNTVTIKTVHGIGYMLSVVS